MEKIRSRQVDYKEELMIDEEEIRISSKNGVEKICHKPSNTFRKELETLLSFNTGLNNKNKLDDEFVSNMILANFLQSCLVSYDQVIEKRTELMVQRLKN